MKRSFPKFEKRLSDIGLREKVEKRSLSHQVTLTDLYEGDHSQSVVAARKDVYSWLFKQGKSNVEIARLFDRAPSSVWKLKREQQ